MTPKGRRITKLYGSPALFHDMERKRKPRKRKPGRALSKSAVPGVNSACRCLVPLRLVFLQPNLIVLTLVWMQSSKIQRNRAHGYAILNSGAMHILDFCVRLISHPSGAAILNSGVPTALKLRSGRKKRNHAHDFNLAENLKIWSHGDPRLNRSPSTHPRETQSLSPHL